MNVPVNKTPLKDNNSHAHPGNVLLSGNKWDLATSGGEVTHLFTWLSFYNYQKCKMPLVFGIGKSNYLRQFFGASFVQKKHNK